jgi:hypothetical protein
MMMCDCLADSAYAQNLLFAIAVYILLSHVHRVHRVYVCTWCAKDECRLEPDTYNDAR